MWQLQILGNLGRKRLERFCPPLGGFQMSDYQTISMAHTLREGGRSICQCSKERAASLQARSAQHWNPLSTRTENQFSLLCHAVSKMSPHNQLISNCLGMANSLPQWNGKINREKTLLVVQSKLIIDWFTPQHWLCWLDKAKKNCHCTNLFF